MEVKSEYGSIRYRFPDIAEGTILLGRMGVRQIEDMNSDNEENSDLVMMGKMLRHIDPYIESVDLKDKEGKEIKDVVVAKNNFIYMSMFYEIAASFMDHFDFGDKKKADS